MSTTARRKAGTITSTVEMNERETRALTHLTMCKQSYATDIHTKALYNRLVNKGLAKINDAGFWEVTPKGRRLAARGADLRGGKGASKMGGSQQPGSRKVGRDRAKPDTSTYEGRFAARLGELVSKRDIDPRDLAKTLGVNQSVVYDWLAGRKFPSIDRFPALAKALGVKKLGDLLPTE